MGTYKSKYSGVEIDQILNNAQSDHMDVADNKSQISGLNQALADTKKDLQHQINTLVLESGGDSNLEVVNARADMNSHMHGTLNDRLESDFNKKADKNTVESLQSQVSTNTTKTVDLQSQIDSLVLAAGGDSNPEVVQARTDETGTTHATLKARIDSSVTDLKSDLKEIYPTYQSDNLFDNINAKKGYYYDMSGVLTPAANWYADDIKECKPSTTYSKYACAVALYDANKNFLSYVVVDDASFTTNSNVRYMGICCFKGFINTGQINEGDTLKPYDKYVKGININKVAMLNEKLYDSLKQINVNPTNYATLMPDVNDVKEPVMCTLNFNYGTTNIPANLPYNSWGSESVVLFISTKDDNVNQQYERQILISNESIWTRYKSSTWKSWNKLVDKSINNDSKVVVDINDGGDFTSLTEAIISGAAKNIYVRKGTYNLISEFEAKYGADFFSNYQHTVEGLVLDGHKIYMDSGAKVEFNYTGANADVIQYFSPFIMQGIGGEIYGGEITGINCRYAIHDDVYDNSAHSKSVISGCVIKYTGTRSAIGGGLGQSSDVLVENNIIESNNTGDSAPSNWNVFYHNTATGNGKSNVKIINNVMTGTARTIVVEGYGTSITKSTAIVTGNKCYSADYVIYDGADNFDCYIYNNSTEK